MIERVAAVLATQDNSSDPHKRAAEVIEAMREPTDKMVAKGSWASDGRGEIGSTGSKNAWRNMIDEALCSG